LNPKYDDECEKSLARKSWPKREDELDAKESWNNLKIEELGGKNFQIFN